MNIAYSCAGEGLGHAARMAALYEGLSIQYRLSLFVPQTVEAFVKERLGNIDIHALPCFERAKQGTRIKYSSTVFNSLYNIWHFKPSIRKQA